MPHQRTIIEDKAEKSANMATRGPTLHDLICYAWNDMTRYHNYVKTYFTAADEQSTTRNCNKK